MSLARTFRRYRGWIAAGTLLAIGGTAYLLLQRGGEDAPTVSYQTQEAADGTLSITVSGTGNLDVDGTTDVYAPSSGLVASVNVLEGAEVVTGTILFTLDADAARANTARSLASYRQAQQGVLQAEGQLLKATNNLADLEDRYEEQSTAPSTPGTATSTTQMDEVTRGDIDVADKDIDTAEAGLTSAKASCASALLAYEQAQAAENDLVVVSPVSGIVWSLDVAEGDSVSPASGGGATASATGAASAAPVVIAPDQPLTVRLAINEVDIPALEVGQRADIEFDALPELTATGKVYSIDSEGLNTQGVVTYDVWLTLDVVDAALKPSMSAAATIVTKIAKDALLVPNAAVKSDTDGSYVEVLDAHGTEPRQVRVETGLSNASQTQIVSGLETGTPVVTQTTDSSDDEGGGGGLFVPGMGGGRP